MMAGRRSVGASSVRRRTYGCALVLAVARIRMYGARVKPSLLTALLCFTVTLALGVAAWAARPATDEERDAVSALYVDSPECSEVIVSEHDGRYARWDFVPSDVCEPFGNGFGIARRDGSGAWHDVYQASENSDACPLTPLPTNVGVELRACSRPSRRVYITNFASGRALIRPRMLPHGAHSSLERLRWRRWHRRVATARGVLDYSDRYTSFSAPVRLRAHRIDYCGAKRAYTRLTIRFVRRADRRRYPHFSETRRLGCPD